MKSKFKNFICFMLVALFGIAMITPDDAQARSPLWDGGLHQQQDDSNHVAGEDVRILSVNWADSFGNTKDADTNGLHTQQDDLICKLKHNGLQHVIVQCSKLHW